MDSFDIRPRNQSGIRLVFLTRVDGHVIAKPAGRIPVVIHEKKWLKMRLWENKKDMWRERDAKPANVLAVKQTLEALGHGTITQIAKASGLSKPTVGRIVNRLHDQKQAYVWDWETGEGCLRIKIWALGAEEDAPRPPKQAPEIRSELARQYQLEYEARKAERQRKAVRSNTVPMRDELTAAFFGSAR